MMPTVIAEVPIGYILTVTNQIDLSKIDNYLVVDGQEVLISAYPKLFEIIGYQYNPRVKKKYYWLRKLLGLELYDIIITPDYFVLPNIPCNNFFKNIIKVK